MHRYIASPVSPSTFTLLQYTHESRMVLRNVGMPVPNCCPWYHNPQDSNHEIKISLGIYFNLYESCNVRTDISCQFLLYAKCKVHTNRTKCWLHRCHYRKWPACRLSTSAENCRLFLLKMTSGYFNRSNVLVWLTLVKATRCSFHRYSNDQNLPPPVLLREILTWAELRLELENSSCCLFRGFDCTFVGRFPRMCTGNKKYIRCKTRKIFWFYFVSFCIWFYVLCVLV